LFSLSLHKSVDKQRRFRALTKQPERFLNPFANVPLHRLPRNLSLLGLVFLLFFVWPRVSSPAQVSPSSSCKHFRRALQGHEGKTAGATFGGAYSTRCGLYQGSRRASTLCRMRTRTLGTSFFANLCLALSLVEALLLSLAKPSRPAWINPMRLLSAESQVVICKALRGTVLDLVSRERPDNRRHARKRKRGGRKII
jgi:hypothetical protein